MTSHASGPLRRPPTWSHRRPWKRSASLRPADLFGAGARASAASIGLRRCHGREPRSPLDVRPGVHPVVVVHTVAAPVTAIGERRLPVVHLLPERRMWGMVLVAELRVLRQAGSLRRRRQRGWIA